MQDSSVGKLVHDLDPPPNLLEVPFNEVGGSYVLPSVCRVTHVSQTGIEIFLQALYASRMNLYS
jgi:hypothetical protein